MLLPPFPYYIPSNTPTPVSPHSSILNLRYLDGGKRKLTLHDCVELLNLYLIAESFHYISLFTTIEAM